MEGGAFWSAVAAIGTCVATIVAILTYRNSRQQKAADSVTALAPPSRPAAAVQETPALDFDLEVAGDPPSGSVHTIRGTTPARKGPRELDIRLKGDETVFFMHPPGKWSGARFRIPLADLQAAAAAESRVLTDPRSGKQLVIRLQSDLPEEVGPDEVRLEGDWWIYVPRVALREALASLGVSVDW
jgi:hypothetical protein